MEIKAAIVQAAPVPLAIGDGIGNAADWARDAIDDGARIVAFGETFLGGYPIWLDEAPDAAGWDQSGTKALHRILLDQAWTEGDPRGAPLQELADTSGALISIGTHERRGNSLFNTQLLFRPHEAPLPHRKLVPTHGERLIWNRGDGSTLAVHDADWGKFGSLICWEHWMPLARAAMHYTHETVHVAAWPTVRETYRLASRHYAFKGRCFVLAAGTLLHRDDLLDGLERVGGDRAAQELLETLAHGTLQSGGSAIIGPDAELLCEAADEETILTAMLDLDRISEELAALDSTGHYSRPDVFELQIDRRAREGVRDAD